MKAEYTVKHGLTLPKDADFCCLLVLKFCVLREFVHYLIRMMFILTSMSDHFVYVGIQVRTFYVLGINPHNNPKI
jgi:hypothetical protein